MDSTADACAASRAVVILAPLETAALMASTSAVSTVSCVGPHMKSVSTSSAASENTSKICWPP